MSNSCPGFIRSICRNSAGKTIWPLEEMVVFMKVRYRLTHAVSSALAGDGGYGLRETANATPTRLSLGPGLTDRCRWVHKPAMKRSAARRLGERLRPLLR